MQTAEKIYAMLGNENLWQTAAQCHRILAAGDIAQTVCGGVAVCLHGYQRNTVDLDLIIEPERAADVRQLLEEAGLTWDAAAKEFRTSGGVAVQFLMTGDRAGIDSEVRIPVPTGELNIEIEEWPCEFEDSRYCVAVQCFSDVSSVSKHWCISKLAQIV